MKTYFRANTGVLFKRIYGSCSLGNKKIKTYIINQGIAMYFLFMLLLPILLIAQNVSYRDTVIAYNGRAAACRVTALNDSHVEFVYSKNVSEKIVIEGVRRLVIDSLGTVYASDKGFVVEPDEVNLLLARREKIFKINSEREKKRHAAIEKLNRLGDTGEETADEKEPAQLEPDWSFGFEYIPYFLGNVFRRIPNAYYNVEIDLPSYSKVMMESSFSYGINEKFRILFNLGYSEFNFKYRRNRTAGYDGNIDKSGFERVANLRILFAGVGVKYRLKNFSVNSVSPYLTANVGKRFASGDKFQKELYPKSGGSVFENNEDQFLEEINSPYFLSAGFGAEYFFNNSLALFSELSFNYSYAKSTFKNREVGESYEDASSDEYIFSAWETRIGVGLNFYF